MCFYKTVKQNGDIDLIHKVSDKDIVCYKTVYERSPGNVYSDIRAFHYVIGETYTENSIPLSELDERFGLEGGVFHSYIDFGIINLQGMMRNNLSYHSKCYVMKCIIPAGTPYWESKTYTEYASTSIKAVELLDPSDLLKHH